MRYPHVVTSDLYEDIRDKMSEDARIGVGLEPGPDHHLYVIAQSGFGAGAYVVFKREQIDEIISLLQDVKADLDRCGHRQLQ